MSWFPRSRRWHANTSASQRNRWFQWPKSNKSAQQAEAAEQAEQAKQDAAEAAEAAEKETKEEKAEKVQDESDELRAEQKKLFGQLKEKFVVLYLSNSIFI